VIEDAFIVLISRTAAGVLLKNYRHAITTGAALDLVAALPCFGQAIYGFRLTSVTLHAGSETVSGLCHAATFDVTEPVQTLDCDWSYCALP
jgi:hypothetical protein